MTDTASLSLSLSLNDGMITTNGTVGSSQLCMGENYCANEWLRNADKNNVYETVALIA